MDVKNLVFRGDLQPSGDWYGKMNGVHKGEKLATEFINGKKLNLVGNTIKEKELLQRYLQSGHHNYTTLTNAFKLIKEQIQTPSGTIVIPAELSPSIGPATFQNIKIQWEP